MREPAVEPIDGEPIEGADARPAVIDEPAPTLPPLPTPPPPPPAPRPAPPTPLTAPPPLPTSPITAEKRRTETALMTSPQNKGRETQRAYPPLYQLGRN